MFYEKDTVHIETASVQGRRRSQEDPSRSGATDSLRWEPWPSYKNVGMIWVFGEDDF